MDNMPILGEDQKAALIERLRQGAPVTTTYIPPDMKKSVDLGMGMGKKYKSLKDQGDGSAWEGMKTQLGGGNPNLYADNYQSEFGQYDPAFKANPTGAVTAPVGQTPPQTSGMFGNMGNTMAGWFK